MDILVVENDASVLSSIVELIQRWGYSAKKSETGQETLNKVREKVFDLVLLDTHLPDMTAQELITGLKELRPEIGIVTMTGANTRELENEIRTLGIIYYMQKPIREEVLKEILGHMSRKKGNNTEKA